MKWLGRIFNLTGDPPEHIKRALESAAKATEATDEAKGAAEKYWEARAAEDRLRLAKIDATLANEQRR